MSCSRQNSFKDTLTATAFLPNLSLHITNFEILTPLDYFLSRRAASSTDFAINSGNILLSRSFVPTCNIK